MYPFGGRELVQTAGKVPLMTAAQIENLEAELASLEAEIAADFGAQIGGGSLRTKAHGQRVHAHIRRAGERQSRIEQLRRQISGLRIQAQENARGPVTLEAIKTASLVRTKYGWYEVVKVNAKSVKVVAERGMDDLIPFKKIIEVR